MVLGPDAESQVRRAASHCPGGILSRQRPLARRDPQCVSLELIVLLPQGTRTGWGTGSTTGLTKAHLAARPPLLAVHGAPQPRCGVLSRLFMGPPNLLPQEKCFLASSGLLSPGCLKAVIDTEMKGNKSD